MLGNKKLNPISTFWKYQQKYKVAFCSIGQCLVAFLTYKLQSYVFSKYVNNILLEIAEIN